MTKPKLDASEQRWVARKLAQYTFDLKHIPGTKNTVANALSRLITEQYSLLLDVAKDISHNDIQDIFRLKVQCHRVTKSKAKSVNI